MAGYNRVVLVGNLTRDPDYKQLTSGQAVCRLSLASNRQYKNRQTGNLVQEVCYIDVDVWGPQAESANQYLQKGRAVLIEGRLKFDTWEDPASGQNRSKHSVVADRVVFLSSGGDNSESEDEATTAPTKSQPARNFAPKKAAAPAAQSADFELEKELSDQIDAIKRKNKQKSEAAAAPAGSEMAFKDEPPFEDELPF